MEYYSAIKKNTFESVLIRKLEPIIQSEASQKEKHQYSMLLLLLLLLSRFSRVQLCETPQTAAQQAPSSLGFSRQEHWSGLPFPSPMQENEKWKWSRSVVSDSLRPHGLQPIRLLCLWGFPGKSTGVGCHRLLHSLIYSFKNENCWIWKIDKCMWITESVWCPPETHNMVNQLCALLCLVV